MTRTKARLLPALTVLTLTSVEIITPVEPAMSAGSGTPLKPQCNDDAILVFDASGSMAGTDMNSVTPHIAKVREAVAAVLARVTPERPLGLVTYGPGPYGRCQSIELNVPPAPNTAQRIMNVIDALVPAGETPLTQSVELAAEALKFREKPATVVLLTDGEETCGGDPCKLARTLKASGRATTVHVIGYRTPVSLTLGAGLQSTRCLADETGGLFIQAENKAELIDALNQTLTCPNLSNWQQRQQQRAHAVASLEEEEIGNVARQPVDVGRIIDVAENGHADPGTTIMRLEDAVE